MINIKKYISDNVKDILKTEKNIIVEIPPRDNMGDYSVPCFSLKDENHPNPVEIAEIIKDNFNDSENYFQKIFVMGPYINFELNMDIFGNMVTKEILENKNYGSLNQGNNEDMLIEHTSINPNASPHLGRSRCALIGDFLSRLYKFTGYNVERHYFVNDIGKQIAMLVVGCEKYGSNNLSFNDMLDLYVKINNEAKNDENILNKAFEYLNKLENGDEEIREKFKEITDLCVEGQMKIFKQIDIEFDVFTHESDFVYGHITDEILDKIKEKGKLKEDENGRLYADLSDYDIPTKNPVLVLTRGDKSSLYPLRDLAYSIFKIKRNDKNNLIVLGEDQIVYMQQIAATLDIIGYPAPKLTSYSFVLLDGAKMATRDGTLVLLEDFIKVTNEKLKEAFKERNLSVTDDNLNVLMNACIKFTMLNVSKSKVVNFNLDKATSFTGESGVYILYSIVRINSILNKLDKEYTTDNYKFTNDIEFKILKDLYAFPEIINNLLATHEPATLTKYIFTLTQKFSKLYEEVNISNETDEVLKASRIALIKNIRTVLTNGLEILGIKTIDKM